MRIKLKKFVINIRKFVPLHFIDEYGCGGDIYACSASALKGGVVSFMLWALYFSKRKATTVSTK
jgi:hypothetical protein